MGGYPAVSVEFLNPKYGIEGILGRPQRCTAASDGNNQKAKEAFRAFQEDHVEGGLQHRNSEKAAPLTSGNAVSKPARVSVTHELACKSLASHEDLLSLGQVSNPPLERH